MKLLNVIRPLLNDVYTLKVVRSCPFQIAVLLIVLVWVLDPAIDAFLFQEGTYIKQLFSPEPMEIYFRTSISLLIAFIGFISAAAFLRLDRQQQALDFERKKLTQIIESGPECIKTIDRNGILLEINPAGLKIIEADSLGQVQGALIYDLIAPEHRQLYIDFNHRIFAGGSEKIQYDVIGLKGTRTSVESHAVPLRDSSGAIVAHLAMTRDITQSHKLTEELSHQATHDMLTGLINRHEFEQRLSNTLTLAVTDESTHGVFFIDIDQFKVINDTYGHMAGDQLLQQVGSIMHEHVREQDSVARLGGDEFAILLQYCSPKWACNIAEKLRLAINDFSLPWEGRQLKVSVSIGVVSIDNTCSRVSDILRDAGISCYLAKERGRNRVRLHQKDDEITIRHRGEMHWVAKIHEGIEEQRFFLAGQVIKSLDSQSPDSHVELLLRYREENNTVLPPGAFLPAAERYAISPKLDRYVVETAFTLLNRNSTLYHYADAFCINLSGLSLGEDDFLQFVIQQFQRYPNLTTKICFEITETAAISNLESARRFIKELKSIGCRFALDDFGSGLSSFGYLKNLPVDYLKIDGCFVRDIVDDPVDLAMVRSINDIGHLMGTKTIAEFVENDEIKRLLQQLGVDYVQGYGIAKSLPLLELIDAESKCRTNSSVS